MYKNIFYFHELNAIGGIETFLYSVASKYQDFDITVFYTRAAPNQIRKLSQVCRVRKFNGERIQCVKAFFCYRADIIDFVDAEEYYMCIHGDYKALKIRPLPLYPQITHYVGCGKYVSETFAEVSGKEVETLYNPIVVEKPNKILNLISATRLTAEKGKDRMKIFGKILREAGIPYIWTVYTNDTKAIDDDNIIFRKPRTDIVDYMANSDYLVQLSDTEGYCYAIIESLCVGTPVIVTDLPCLWDLGVENGKNAFILPFDMSNVPIQEIYKGLPPFEYTPHPDRWGEILAPGENTYKEERKQLREVKCIKRYYDVAIKREIMAGEILTMSIERADIVCLGGFGEIVS